MLNANNILMVVVKEEGIVIICTSNHYQRHSKDSSSNRCIFSILNIKLKRDRKVQIHSKEKEGRGGRGRIRNKRNIEKRDLDLMKEKDLGKIKRRKNLNHMKEIVRRRGEILLRNGTKIIINDKNNLIL
jgi:hypothetical protein